MDVELTGVTVHRAGRAICDAVRLELPDGSITGIVGPNGAGKSTLLRTIYRVIAPSEGLVLVGGDDVRSLSQAESARRTATVIQEPTTDFDFTVRQVVALGRTPHKGRFDRLDNQDATLIDAALERVGVADLEGRSYGTLSGGEKQRVLIARALAQQARVLILDEPTNHLDIRYQLAILELVRELEITVVAAMHDLNLAADYCDRLVVMDHGAVVAAGRPHEVLTDLLVAEVFGVAADVIHEPDGRPWIRFRPLHSPRSADPSPRPRRTGRPPSI